MEPHVTEPLIPLDALAKTAAPLGWRITESEEVTPKTIARNGGVPALDVRFTPNPYKPAANRVTVFVAPKGGAGKTTITLLAATLMASRGARVLVIDATEGQGGLSLRLASDAVAGERAHGLGALARRVYDAANELRGLPYHLLLRSLREREVGRRAVSQIRREGDIRRISVDPSSPACIDFVPAGHALLSQVGQNSEMANPMTRQAVFQTIMDGLQAEFAPGWDYVFIDVVPNSHSLIMKAAMGVADRVAVVVDMRSAMPLAGLDEIIREVDAIKHQTHRPNPDVLGGLVLNRISSGTQGQMSFITRVEQLETKAFSQNNKIPVLAKIREMDSLALLGVNILAVETLEASFPDGKLPDHVLDADEPLTEKQVDAISAFMYAQGQEQGIGVRYLAARHPGGIRSPQGQSLLMEELELAPAVLELVGEDSLLVDLLTRREELQAEAQGAGEDSGSEGVS